MKLNRILVISLALASLSFFSCSKEGLDTGIDPSLPVPQKFTYDAENSNATTIAVYWDAAAAVKAGATGFTVQIPTGKTNGDNYDNTQSQTISTSASVYDAAIFSNLTEYDRHYVRVRANYPMSKYSEWVYLGLNGGATTFEVGYGFIDSTLASINNLAYNFSKSTKTAMDFDYDAATAESKGAKTLRFQLINNTTYKIDKTITADCPVGDYNVLFSSLKTGANYKVRARAEYAGSDGLVTCSEWAYAATDTTSMFTVGFGPEVEKLVAPATKLVRSSSSTLTFQWSETGFVSPLKDITRPISAALYKDAACKNLVVSWDFGANNTIFGSAIPTFLFSGLDQNTTYYFVATDTDSKLSSEPLAATTDAFTVVTVGKTKVAEGGVAVAEDFSELPWGGDMLFGAAGYSASGRSSAASFDKASGASPIGGGSGYYFVNSSTEIGLFNTLKLAIPATDHLKYWGQITEDGTGGGIICARPGMLKLGASSKIALVSTPVLSNLSGIATVKVTFKGHLYGTDPTTAAIYLVSGAKFTTTSSSINEVTGTQTKISDFAIDATEGKWKDYSFDVENVSPQSAIAIGPTREGVSGQHRMYIDDIVVTVVKYTGAAITVATPANLKLAAKSSSITASWDAVDKAEGYVVEYKKSSDSDWTVMPSTTATSVTIDGLVPETAYSVRVKATMSGVDSDYATGTATTAAASALSTEISTGAELVKWLAAATDAATGTYKITADLDMKGLTASAAAGFAGTLDGQGHTIKNWTSTTPLFASNKGTVKNIVIDATCKFYPASAIFGTIASVNEGSIENCTNSAPVKYEVSDATETILQGGIAGQSTGTIKNCISNGAVTVTSEAGLLATGAAGIAAYQAGEISGCENHGKITLSGLYLTSKSTAVGSISAAVPCEGGIVAFGGSGFKMSECKNYGIVDFTLTQVDKTPATGGVIRNMIGGIAGAPSGDITDCNNYAAVNVTANSSTGATYSTIEYNICVGGISGGDYFASNSQNATNITKCINAGAINVDSDISKSNSTVGGIVGWPGIESTAQTIFSTDCQNVGNITITGTMKVRVGGIQGGSGNMAGCKNSGDIVIESANSASVVGALCGFHSQNHAITSCTAAGSVTANCDVLGVGGLIGNNGNAANSTGAGCVINCALKATSAANIGLIIGYFNGSSKAITIGTSESPVKVAGSVNGTAITASNFQDYLHGATNYSATNHVFNVAFGE